MLTLYFAKDKKKIFVYGGVLAVVVLFISACIGFFLTQPVSSVPGKPVVITVKTGMTSDRIAELLYQQGVIRSVKVFQTVARMHGMESSLQAGDYAFTQDMPVAKIVDMLSTGETSYLQITIPEGYTIDQIAQLLSEKSYGNAAKFKEAARKYAPYDYMAPQQSEVYVAEGYAFPDTYSIGIDFNEEKLLSTMVAHFNEKVTPEIRQMAEAKGLSVRQLIILASLVEKEAKFAKDRPIIAGVFLNRLKQGMPLQSCATIQYILGYPKAELSVKDTELESPYNTYQHAGLPPGPIANPGMAAIQAVINSTPTEYLYFVADKNGEHHFSKTYEEHLAWIDKVSN
ncbi:MAG: endolytic transglycosylase MltG [Pelosinus sp.]|nr:endolytic transglycosylase MltG [Pelosinus sp.]